MCPSEQLDKALSVQTAPKTILSWFFFNQAVWFNHLAKSAKGKKVSAGLFLLVLQSFSQCLSPRFPFSAHHRPWVQLQFPSAPEHCCWSSPTSTNMSVCAGADGDMDLQKRIGLGSGIVRASTHQNKHAWNWYLSMSACAKWSLA